MVHALETIHHLLEPGGTLIDLRPKGIPAEFWGWRGAASGLLGHLQETDDYIEYRHAAWAMEQAVDNQWFRLLKTGEYKFVIHAGTFEEIKAYLDVEWTDAVIPLDVQKRSDEMRAERIALHDLIHIGVLISVK